MKKLLLPLLLAFSALFYLSSCQKTTTHNSEEQLVEAARSYFQLQWQNAPSAVPIPNPRNSGKRIPDWSKARVLILPKATAVIVPVHYAKPFYLGSNFGGIRQYLADDLTQLIVYKDSANIYHAEMITALPDSNYKDLSVHPFTGMILVDQWNGHPIARYRYDDRPARVWRPDQSSQRQVIPDGLIIETCYEVGGYNYAPSDPAAGYAWSEEVGCANQFINEVPSTGLLDAASYSTVAAGGVTGGGLAAIYPGDGGIVDGAGLTFQYGPEPGIDLAKYFKCFTYIPDQGATYSVTLCTDIPVNENPGALLTTSLQVGHVFIILTKTNGQVSLSQSFGFYPESQRLSGTGIYVQSEIKDDGAVDHEYNASLSMPNISQLDFQTVENFALNLATSQQYSLYNYNCTDYALQVFNSIRVNNPVAVSDWIGIYTGIDFGKTPNGLYENLVQMKTFFAGASNPNIQIGTMHAPSSAGVCN